MKRIAFAICTLAFFAFGLIENKLTDEERSKAVEHLTQTRDNMLSTLEGLSDEQLNYKPTEDSWSIAECVEHLAISENAIPQTISTALQETADMARRSEVAMSDEELLGMITDRSNKIKTSESFVPSGKFGSYEETLEAFLNKREENINFVKTTEDDLRHHYSKFPFGTVDAYQVVLFMSGHTARHTKQMQEVMEDPGFPEE
jgi:predicted dinucleotide-utilizing enzyme